MQMVSLVGGPHLTGPQFWASLGGISAGGALGMGPLGFSFSHGLDGEACGPIGGNGVGVGPTVVLRIPNGGNTGHALNGHHFTTVVAGKTVVWQLTETPAVTTDIGITNGDSAATVAGKIATAWEGGAFQSAFGFQFINVVAIAKTANADGTCDVMFLGIDSALSGAIHLGPVAAPLTAPVPDALSTVAWGFKLLKNAGHTFVYQGIGEAGAVPAGVDMSTLTIVAWGFTPGHWWAGMPRVSQGIFNSAPG